MPAQLSLLARRAGSLVVALFVGLGLLAVTGAAADAAPTAAHPYSDPVYLPVHSAFGLDCAGQNPGCTATRDFYSVDIVPAGQFGPHGSPSHTPVYAMGAGVVHVGEAHGTACGSTSKTSFGTWIWVDHGGGYVSRYGHLSAILVHDGAHVDAGTAIGRVGATGKAKNCNVNYLDFMIEHGGVSNDNAHRFSTLRACSASTGATQTWPGDAATTRSPSDRTPVHYTSWSSVPHGTQFPASSGACIDSRTASAAGRPAPVTLRHPGHGRLTVSWRSAPGPVMVELSRYHSGGHRWDKSHQEVYRSLSAAHTSIAFTGLIAHCAYRARISVRLGGAWSLASSWRSRTA